MTLEEAVRVLMTLEKADSSWNAFIFSWQEIVAELALEEVLSEMQPVPQEALVPQGALPQVLQGAEGVG